VRSRRRRSSGECGVDAMVHGRRGWWALRAPGSALSTSACSVWMEVNQNDDGDKSGAGEVSVSTELWPRARKHEGRERGSAQRLTAEL
jgi:hypothetical protein